MLCWARTSYFLQSNILTKINSNQNHVTKPMSMQNSMGWVRGEAPLSAFGQFCMAREPRRSTSSGLQSRRVTQIDKWSRVNQTFQCSTNLVSLLKYHSSAAGVSECTHTEGKLHRGTEAFLTKMLWLASLLLLFFPFLYSRENMFKNYPTPPIFL